MKKTILLIMVSTIFFGFLHANFERKVYVNTNIEDDFHPSNVLVVLDKSISDFNKVHDSNLFGQFEKSSIKDIFQIHNHGARMAVVENIGRGEFRQLFKITLPTENALMMLPYAPIQYQVERVYKVNSLKSERESSFYTVSLRNEKSVIEVIPSISSLVGNYPNPFNPSTTISYNIAQSENVKLQVFNVKGQLVRTLVNNLQDAGFHSIIWNGIDDSGRSVSSGIYFYRLETNSTIETKRLLLVK